MSILQLSILLSITAAIIILVVYLSLNYYEKHKYLIIWSYAWIAFALRGVIVFVRFRYFPDSIMLIAFSQVFTYLNALLLFAGIFVKKQKLFQKKYIVLAIIPIVWVLGAYPLVQRMEILILPIFLITSLLFFASGIIALRIKLYGKTESAILLVLFALWGFHNLIFLILIRNMELVPYSIILSSGLILVLAFISLIAHYRELKNVALSSNKKYELLIGQARSAIIIVDLEGKIQLYSDFAEKIFGYTKEEVLGNHIVGLILPEKTSYNEDLRNIVAEAFNDIEKYHMYETECLTKDGRRLWVGWQNQLIIDDDGKRKSILCIGVDNTEKRNFELDLYREIQVNEALVEISRDILSPVYSIDQLAVKLLEYSLKIANAKNGVVILIHEQERKIEAVRKSETETASVEEKKYSANEFSKVSAKYLKYSNTSYINETQQLNESKKLLFPNVAISNLMWIPILLGNKQIGLIALSNKQEYFRSNDLDYIQKIAGIYTVANVRIKLDDELIDAKQKAEESDKLKTSFLANMSHEIRTPLNGIIGFSEMLGYPTLPAEKRSYFIKIIKDRSDDLVRIINDLLDISQIELGMLSLEYTQINIRTILEQLKTEFEQFIATETKKDIQIELNIEPCTDSIISDSVRLKQILSILLDNAVKFTPQGKIEIHFKCIRDDKYAQFTIRDTGIGIAEDKLDIIFDRFRQSDESFTRQFGGNGLGLSICKGLTELFGGSVKVRSELEKGSTFIVELPLINDQSAEPEPDDLKLNNVNKALIVDDDIISAEYIAEVLNLNNINSVIASSAKEALSKLKQEKNISTALIDIHMPEINGIELMKCIKDIYPSITCVAQTAFAMQNERSKFLYEGFDAYLAKPLKVEELLQLLGK
jgi:PAS domain S-box-containing protein